MVYRENLNLPSEKQEFFNILYIWRWQTMFTAEKSMYVLLLSFFQ